MYLTNVLSTSESSSQVGGWGVVSEKKLAVVSAQENQVIFWAQVKHLLALFRFLFYDNANLHGNKRTVIERHIDIKESWLEIDTEDFNEEHYRAGTWGKWQIPTDHFGRGKRISARNIYLSMVVHFQVWYCEYLAIKYRINISLSLSLSLFLSLSLPPATELIFAYYPEFYLY